MNVDQFMRQPRPMCGGCKATGLHHVWTKDGDLVPAEPRRPCEGCNGTGWLGEDFVNAETATFNKGEVK